MRRKTNGRKSKKTRIYNGISNQRRWNFALQFKTFDLPPYGKESSCNFKNILEGYVSTKTGYRLPNVHTLHNQVHIVVGGAMHGRCIFSVKRPGLSSSSFLCGSYPSEKWGFAISTRALRFWNIRCTSRTQQRWRHCTTLCCVYSSTDF